MSLTSLRPASFALTQSSTSRSGAPTSNDSSTRSLQHSSAYINLSRQLAHFSNLVLLTPSPQPSSYSSPTSETELSITDLSPLQRKIQSDLYSPVAFQRTKWLHQIEGARNLLLQLEREAQGIKVQKTRTAALRDLAAKRKVVRRLRERVEEIGREVESMGDAKWQTPPETTRGETLWDVVQQRAAMRASEGGAAKGDERLLEGRPVQDEGEELPEDQEKSAQEARDDLFNSGNTSSTIRRRDKQTRAATSPTSHSSMGKSTGVSSHEKSMHSSAADQEALTTSLVSLAAQLKQQTRAFQFSLDQDKGLLNRAIEGLEGNITGLDAASRNMQFLKRMSEGEGWWGRMKLYAIIFGLWVVAILLVFVMPKLRF
ncbi:uncharacterized protein HMPREF1541_02825 [Cyphellophora europaea CBS 101466]|uniref:t-SNARE coiled-coil homology domain-containing protein n=1 Tax=Cyphellophora europaea (strain CBS 101466) TaxID=1220924 RepID=W2S4N7_CYPE1|nr:uncharacterized protein HMPREF1541_02825 [Cyphellophora europaea CBS 101466]ETN43666.1 hypothetical protein HMPREF1541_02825 [Cyphellophora europaea CBS 101466]